MSRWRHQIAAIVLCGLASLAAPPAPAAAAEFELTPLTRQTLARLRATSQEWVLAQESGAVGNAETAVQDLIGTAQTLGFRRLPDVAIAGGLLAERAARRDDAAGAERALAVAERLDSGRPETSFAAAAVARSEGRWFTALRAQFEGGRRLLDSRPLGRLLRHDLAISAIYVVLLTAGAMVVLLAGLHGRRIVGSLLRGLEPAISRPVGLVLIAAALLWPLAFGDGLGLAIGLVAIVLCGFVSWSERIVLILALGLFCLAPWALARLERRAAVDASPGVRALDHLAAGRLSGTLFADLETLDAQLPEEPALRAIQAEVHRRLGQWELARQLYNEMIAANPGDPTPVIGLGAYHFARNDFKRAVEQFQRAVVIDPRSVEAHFNLSQAYGSGYLFGDAGSALAQASAIDPARVAGWVASPPVERLVVPDPVKLRRAELDRALLVRRPTVGFGRLPLWAAGLAAWLLSSAVGLAIYAARSRAVRKAVGTPGASGSSGSLGSLGSLGSDDAPFERLSPVWAALLPGATSVVRGRPFVAWLAWMPVGGLLGVAVVSHWTPPLPAPILGGSTLAAILSLLALAGWIAVRWLWARWTED